MKKAIINENPLNKELFSKDVHFFGSKSNIDFGDNYNKYNFGLLKKKYVFYSLDSKLNNKDSIIVENFISLLIKQTSFKNINNVIDSFSKWKTRLNYSINSTETNIKTNAIIICKVESPMLPVVGIVTNYYINSKNLQIELLGISENLFINNYLTDEANSLLQLIFNYKHLTKNKRDKLRAGTISNIVNLLLDKYGYNVDAIYFQLPNPISLNSSYENQLKVAEVLNALGDAGAKWIKFNYWLPILNSSNEKHLLLTFLLTDELIYPIPRVMLFILDYANLLGNIYAKEHYDSFTATILKNKKLNLDYLFKGTSKEENELYLVFSSLIHSREDVDSLTIYLNEIPRLDTPKFRLKRVSICFEILIDEDYFEPIGFTHEHDLSPTFPDRTRFGKFVNWISTYILGVSKEIKPKALYCPVTHSAETALFSYQYQSDPPYFTKQYLTHPQNVTVHMPSVYEFPTEGRLETTYSLYKDKSYSANKENTFPHLTYQLGLKAQASYTYFLKSSVRVWHLVIMPDEKQGGITELELIKFMKFFTGNQESKNEEEKRDYLRSLKFHIEKKDLTNESFEDEYLQKISVYDKLGFHANRMKWLYLAIILFATTWLFKSSIFNSNWWYWIPLWFLIIVDFVKLSIFFLKLIITFYDTVKQTIYTFFSKLIFKNQKNQNSSYADVNDNLIQLLEDLTSVRYKIRENRKTDKGIPDKDKLVSLRNIHSGIVEIDTGYHNKNNFFVTLHEDFINRQETNIKNASNKGQLIFQNQINEFYKSIFQNEENILQSLIESIEVKYSKNKDFEEFNSLIANYILALYCGICMGIIDYTRMGEQEVDDVLTPFNDSKTLSSFVTINRGALMMFAHIDDVLNTFWKTLGVNAYLLIPSAVLAHNDSITIDAEKRLDEILQKLRFNKYNFSISFLIDKRNEIDDLLNDNMLSNVFHYKTEQEIYIKGMESRGINERFTRAKEKLVQLDKMIEIRHEQRTSRFQQQIQLIAALIGTISIYTVIRDFFLDELSSNSDKLLKELNINDIKHLDDKRLEDWPPILKKLFSWTDTVWNWIVNQFFDINSLKTTHNIYILIIILVIVYTLIQRIFDPNKTNLRNKIFRKKRKFILPNIFLKNLNSKNHT